MFKQNNYIQFSSVKLKQITYESYALFFVGRKQKSSKRIGQILNLLIYNKYKNILKSLCLNYL